MESENSVPTIKSLRRVPIAKLRSIHPHNIIKRLKSSTLGGLYLAHIKKHSFIHRRVVFLWNMFVSAYLFIAILFDENQKKRWLPITFSEFARRPDATQFVLEAAHEVQTPRPVLFPAYEERYLKSPHESYVFPAVKTMTINDAFVYGGTNMVLMNNEVICHDLYDFKRDETSEELHTRIKIDLKGKRLRWLLRDKEPETIEVAASFTDSCASNYAHWITEVLPRIALFCAQPEFSHVPIIINDELHSNLLESLACVLSDDREVIMLPVGRSLKVKTLYMTSPTGYVPFGRRNTKLSGHSHGLFSAHAFEVMRQRLFSVISKADQVKGPVKIYLRRKSGVRNLINHQEVESFLLEQGYTIIEPEKLNFTQQVRLFSQAKKVIGMTGAAFANLIFCPQDADIFIMISKHPDTSYWYWQNIACATGKKLHYILGSDVSRHENGIHADFSVDIVMLRDETVGML